MARSKGFGLAIAGTALLLSLLAYAAKNLNLPRAQHASTYPAHDEHPDEHLTIAIDPYDDAEKASLFRTNWRANDYLPIRLIVSNDGDRPVSLSAMKIELITARRVKIQPAGDEDLYRRLARIKSRGDEPSRNPTPIPFPRKGPQVGVSKEAREEVEAAQFRALPVEPHTTQSGFLFFDVTGLKDPLGGASLYITGLLDRNGQQLMYFEIPLESYLKDASRGKSTGTPAPAP